MNAARLSDYGAPPTIAQVAKPQSKPGEVVVRVTAASLNPLDVKLQRGYMKDFFPIDFPYTMGTDFSGIVDAASGTNGLKAGDKVIGRVEPATGGALAEYVIVAASFLTKAPTTVTLDRAAGIPTCAGTAWQALFEVADLQAGQTVLIHAGAGGVGSFAIQFARSVGARVIATASGEGIDTVRRLGADEVVDYRSQDFSKLVSGVDVVLDTIGGETQQRSFRVLRKGGVLVAMAAPPDEEAAKSHGVTATFVFHSSDGARLKRVVDAIDSKKLEVLVDRDADPAQFGDAFERQASGSAHGKIIISFN